jgi:hypothetical protein
MIGGWDDTECIRVKFVNDWMELPKHVLWVDFSAFLLNAAPNLKLRWNNQIGAIEVIMKS